MNTEKPKKEFMTSFGVPIVSRIEGGHSEAELKESISRKLSAMDASCFPSLKAVVNPNRD